MLNKSPEYKDIPVLTIDQCQGKEADYVIFSLVRKPTTFLNRNRLNVALSRVRKAIYFINDKCHFLEASKYICWESHLLAKSLMLTQEFASQAQSSYQSPNVTKHNNTPQNNPVTNAKQAKNIHAIQSHR